MTASDLTDDEWQRLDAEAKVALEAVIAAAENSGAYTSIGYEGGEVYAFPTENGIAWGMIGGENGTVIARGERGLGRKIREDDEDEQHQDGQIAPPAGEERRVFDGAAAYSVALVHADSDENVFSAIFAALMRDAAIDAETAQRIAGAYTGEDSAWPTREAALGAIETHFYAQRQTVSASNDGQARTHQGG
ncbi:MAG: hypothetical protein P8Y67_13740, partial [Alphaproteobacteria bacterium]